MSSGQDVSSDRPGRLERIVPALAWLRGYQPAWLAADVVAGLTLAAYLLPAGLTDASLAQLPSEAGLYACLFPGLVFWIFCSSRHTSITVTSAISLLVGATLGQLGGGDVSRSWSRGSRSSSGSSRADRS
jgi:MFS superfamily sulfate permease-like transporter